MQAIILAAGMGKRLGEHTRGKAKCMVSVAGRPMIDRMLLQLVAMKVNRVIIVTGYMGHELKEHIGSRFADATDIVYIDNDAYATTNNIYSLYLAKDFFADDDTLLLESDLTLDDNLCASLSANPHADVALVSPYRQWMDGTVVTLSNNFRITRFIGKDAFRPDGNTDYYKTVNVYKFSHTFLSEVYLPALEAYRNTHGDNEYYERVLGEIVASERHTLYAQVVGDDLWYEIDDANDLAAAERRFARHGGATYTEPTRP